MKYVMIVIQILTAELQILLHLYISYEMFRYLANKVYKCHCRVFFKFKVFSLNI